MVQAVAKPRRDMDVDVLQLGRQPTGVIGGPDSFNVLPNSDGPLRENPA
eukprot:CAMPEP_0180521954 /NCGR_PEP_ID=MMETSP1036_2-20121128/57131_1 /TAXON_ID=632150 /ORGANISM="Azadinium spinosum, Strain 3D9" /LENGTH=48 /DNA_ID= /DNA_START= /DNA_END= /DNA_ORIENTATION=